MTRRRRKTARNVAGVAIILATMSLGAADRAAAGQQDGSFTATVTAARSYLTSGGDAKVTDTRHITLRVSQTTNLRGRQEVGVSWSGAHPTGATVADVNSGAAANEEYPFVLLECRGVDSAQAAAAARLTPETCWTQTWNERFQKDNNTGWPAWRSDRYETDADRAALVDEPNPRPTACFRPGLAERWVPFVAANKTTYSGGSVGCAGMAPESANVSGAGIPSNATYGITGADGTGTTDFDVWTSDENASLGCSTTVACALVAVPITGISCDAYGTELPNKQRPPAGVTRQADTACRAAGAYKAGEPYNTGDPSDLAVTGALWWSASNWRNRITVPLSFATPASICSVVSSERPETIYGSVLMDEATSQWEPTFCTDSKLYPFIHVQTSDAAARNLLLSNNIDAAFSSRAPDGGFARPVVQAPVAMTGFAITYAIDDAKGNKYTALHLDARLLAKLLTESYPANGLVSANYPALANNPMNLTLDPEFIALNPGLPHYTATEAAATLITLSSDADLVWALTSYINADPEARAWLNGQPDPWGMVVNPSYQDISLPVESWPLLDTFELPQSYIDSQNNPCYSYSPSPYLALIANPLSLMSSIVQDVQFSISNVDIACPNGVPDDVSTLRLSVQGRQQPGFRFVLGVTSVSAAHRYNLQAAKLQTSLDHPDLHAQFTDGTGRTFVAPDNAGLRHAAALLRPDETSRTWNLDYADLRTTAGQGAYPGVMPVYADVPTSGLAPSTAAHLAQLLTYIAGSGQVAGETNGELPPGYLPLTAANGLATFSDYTRRAADAIAAQDGVVPKLKAPPAPTSTSSSPSSTPSPRSSTRTRPIGPGPRAPTVPPVGLPPGGGAVPSAASTPSGAAPSSAPAAASSASSAPAASPSTVALRTAGQYSRLGSFALPALLLVAAAAGLAGGALRNPTALRKSVALVRRTARRGWHRR
jgi:hypothetical protein